MPEQLGAGRLDPETLAAYVDGLLPPEERAKVEAEIATDPESNEWPQNARCCRSIDGVHIVQHGLHYFDFYWPRPKVKPIAMSEKFDVDRKDPIEFPCKMLRASRAWTDDQVKWSVLDTEFCNQTFS